MKGDFCTFAESIFCDLRGFVFHAGGTSFSGAIPDLNIQLFRDQNYSGLQVRIEMHSFDVN